MNILSRLFGPNDVGIDLGTATTRVWVRGEGLLLEEPSAEHSFKDGVIPDFDTTKKALRYCLAKAGWGRLRRLRVLISVHSDITEEQKQTLERAVMAAGAKEVYLLESSMAAAIGAGLPVSEPKGCMVIDLGACMAEFAVISLAGIVHSKLIRVGGNEMDNAIIEYLLKKHNIVVKKQEAEDIKIKIGTACKLEKERDYKIKGRSADDGSQIAITINSREIREEAFSVVLGQIDGALKEILGIIEPELAADLVDNGIVLTGGVAQLFGLDKRLADATGLPVRVADEPTHATIEGVGVVLDELDFLSKHSKKR